MPYAPDFLHTLAKRVVSASTDRLYEHCFVFPSHRAGTFFKHYISQMLDVPAFAPQVITIEELEFRLSGLKQAGKTYLLCTLLEELYRLRQERQPEYTWEAGIVAMDHFERILRDFNDIDLFLAPADKIFRNMEHLEELTSIDYLTEEQRATIVQFWGTLPSSIGHSSSLSMGEEFSSILSEMELLYTRFRERLQREGVGYQGMMARNIVEMDEKLFVEHLATFLQRKIKHITIAGLYQITPAERLLLQRLSQYSSLFSIEFIWEDLPYSADTRLKDIEWSKIIGNALAENRAFFGGEVLKSNIPLTLPEIEIIKTSSDIGRSRIVPTLLQEIELLDAEAVNDLRCAIVLPQEKALVPLLEAIKPIKKDINITMGYPLSNSSTAIWVRRFIDLHLNVRWQGAKVLLPAKLLKVLLRHPMTRLLLSEKEIIALENLLKNSFYYVDFAAIQALKEVQISSLLRLFLTPLSQGVELLYTLQELLEALGKKLYLTLPEEDEETLRHFAQLEIEFTQTYTTVVVQLLNIVEPLQEPLNLTITVRLLRQLVEGENTPFEGEPLLGLQVMGFLESRLINFDYLIIPDANEGMLPKGKSSTVFGYIPNALRIGYGLPTYRFNDYIESYHFYRLISRARRVYFVTGSSQDYEPSRYLRQMRYLLGYPIRERSVQISLTDSHTPPITIKKNEEVIALLERYMGEALPKQPALSASSIYDFAQCPLRFYFKHLCAIGDPEKDEEFLNAGKFGSIVHNTMQQLYKPFEGQLLLKQDIDYYLDPKGGLQTVDSIIRKEYAFIVLNKEAPSAHDIEGIHEVYCRMVRKYVCAILEHDRRYENLTYCASEYSFLFSLPLDNGRRVRIKGFIDRVDQVEGVTRIIDYKTGSDKGVFPTMTSLFFPTDKDKASKAIPQLLLYAYYWYAHKDSSRPILPTLYALKELSKNPAHPIPPLELKELPKNETEIKDFREETIVHPFTEELKRCLENLFDPTQDFSQTPISDFCTYCSYKDICGR